MDDEALRARLTDAGRLAQPELHLRADKATRYERIADVTVQCTEAG